ncbi:uncharacterized protein SRS1_11557 [Sporisorium reilianum f. sp. reilianum]|uniref:Uncharacterized protein n=1 Tax=Sporisorium reilianum f. sp. reilianum TaxID=72559 RepID=A0A2N8U7H3_9BASI|nr:uncharacterized protein SRS1_11557 [Sporisorium reilianum f. sp. reilianum]
MNAACTAAASTAGVTSSTTPPLANAAPSAAHYRLGRTSRRSSSSGSSSSSSGGIASNGSAQQGAGVSRKRRRHSTLSSGMASGSEEEGERAPPMFRLRLGSYVSDLRLTRTRSSSPGSPLYQASAPLSPSGALRQRHQLSIQTSAAVVDSLAKQQDQQRDARERSVSPASAASASMLAQRDSDVEMDLDVQSTFQAMQVDSPTASPSPTTVATAVPFFATTSTDPPRSAAGAAMHRTASARISPIPSNLLSPLVTDTRYPRASSPLSAPPSASFASISLISHTSSASAAVSPGVFPSPSLLAARRSSRQSSMPHQQQQQQHAPASPSPLARLLSFPPPASASASTHTQHPHLSQHLDTPVTFQHPFQQANRSRATSTPPSPVVASDEAQHQQQPETAQQ